MFTLVEDIMVMIFIKQHKYGLPAILPPALTLWHRDHITDCQDRQLLHSQVAEAAAVMSCLTLMSPLTVCSDLSPRHRPLTTQSAARIENIDNDSKTDP